MFWRETGMKEEEAEVEAREGAWSMETAMLARGKGEVVVGAGCLVVECCSTNGVALIGEGDKEA